MKKFNNSKIIGMGFAVPNNIKTNEDLESLMETSDEWIQSRSGIKQRHWSTNKTSTSDLALSASKNEKFDFACTHPWEEMVIGADGRVGLCCLDHELNEQVGDIRTSTIQEIWQGEIINDYRSKQLNLEYASIGSCKDCNAHTYQSNKLWAKLQRP